MTRPRSKRRPLLALASLAWPRRAVPWCSPLPQDGARSMAAWAGSGRLTPSSPPTTLASSVPATDTTALPKRRHLDECARWRHIPPFRSATAASVHILVASDTAAVQVMETAPLYVPVRQARAWPPPQGPPEIEDAALPKGTEATRHRFARAGVSVYAATGVRSPWLQSRRAADVLMKPRVGLLREPRLSLHGTALLYRRERLEVWAPALLRPRKAPTP